MVKKAFKMQLFPGFEDEYKRRHDALWPELQALLKETGIQNYSIFLDPKTLTLFGVMDIADENADDQLPEHPIMQKWWEYMRDIMVTNPDNSPTSEPLQHVFFMP